MTNYEVKTADGVLHSIEAVTHVHDSFGLTLYLSEGRAAAIFPKFEWMRQTAVAAEQAPTAGTTSTTTSGEVVVPAATGE